MSCIKEGMGCSFQGPAGVGKTETIKDFARSIGQMTAVINCSDQIDYKILEKLTKGGVSSGVWTCYD